ncbi:hypothetical protein AM593_00911, partial [Mytilus galloprovincialis]
MAPQLTPLWNLMQYVTACIMCVVVHFSPQGAGNVQSNISKKDVLNFSSQMIAIFGYSRATALLDYGCYCGIGGDGTPVDGMDRCCQVHDKCYGDEESWWCWPKWQHYNYKILNSRTVYCEGKY